MDHRPSRTEQRVKITLLVLVLVLVGGTVLFYLTPGLRLDVWQRLRIVPGIDAVHVTDSGEAQLIVISTRAQAEVSTQRYHQTAQYIVRFGSPLMVTNLANDEEFPLPIDDYDKIQISADRTQLLFRSETGPSAILDLSTDQATAVDDPSGDWQSKVLISNGLCTGTSAHDLYSLCVRQGDSAYRYLIGDWEIQVRPFGESGPWTGVLRGRGLLPIVGFSPDEKSVYAFNEFGIWRAPIPESVGS